MSNISTNTRQSLINNKLETNFSSQEPSIIEWSIAEDVVDYEVAVEFMENRIKQIAAGTAPELIWLVEHPPLYSGGTSAQLDDLLVKDKFPIYYSGRGGEFTYHGPGQRIVYIMLDLKKRKQDVRLFIAYLEQWIISTLRDFNIRGETREERVGVWVQRPEKPKLANGQLAEDKIAAIGIRIKKWITLHGFAINVNPDLSHYNGIIPCGIQEYGITSFEDLGYLTTFNDIDIALKKNFKELFTSSADSII